MREPDDLLPPDAESGEPGEMKPLLGHLEDLRWTVAKILGTVVTAMVVCFFFAPWLIQVLIHPLATVVADPRPYLRTLEVTGGFVLTMQLALYMGLAVSAPLVLYFLGQFLLPGLKAKEKRLLIPAFTAGSVLFVGGAALAYFGVIPIALRFFLALNERLGISSEWTIQSYCAFVSHMVLAFGICFELPLVITVLSWLGVVSHAFLKAKRAYVTVVILIVAAVITPTTDPLSMALLAVPLVVLFEGCIWIAWLIERRRERGPGIGGAAGAERSDGTEG